MTDDHSNLEPPNALVQVAQGPEEPSLRIHAHRNENTMSQLQPSNIPETPTPPPAVTSNGARPPVALPTTLPDKHQIILRHVHTLECRNARLYEDNCKLVNAVNTLNERLAFMAAPQNIQFLRLADLQEKLRTSEASRALTNQKYQELLHPTSPGVAQRHLNEELQAIQEAYARLDRDYRILADKYARLKAAGEASRVLQQQSQGTSRLVPVARSEVANTTQFRAHDQSRNSYASPASAISPLSLQPSADQKENHRRPSFESVMVQPPLRSGPTPMATTWLTPLPTPPPSASFLGGLMSPKGFPVHAPVPAGSLPLPHHPQPTHDPRTLSGLPAVAQSRHLVQQGASEQPIATTLRQRCVDITDTINSRPVPCSNQILAPPSLTSSPRPPKRPNPELLTSVVPEGEQHKKPRVEGEADRPMTINADTHPADKMPSPPTSTDSPDDPKAAVPVSNVRSYEDCVNLIFEKDANVENGVFCGLCLDRYEAKMILEPPDVLVQPEFDYLVRHCMTEHPAVWDDLRRKA